MEQIKTNKYSVVGTYKELKELRNYKKAYLILMEYYDCISDEEKEKVDKRLKRLGVIKWEL